MIERGLVKAGITVASVLLAIAIGFYIWLYGAQTWHMVWSLVRGNWVPWIALLIPAGIGVLIYAKTWKTADAIAPGVFAVCMIAIGLLAFLGLYFVRSYQVYTAYDQSVTVKQAEDSDASMSFKDRAPFDVATDTSNRTLGDTTGDSTGSLKAIPMKGEYTVSIVRRGIFKGYESTQVMTVPTYGTASNNDVKFCQFSEDAKLRFGGAVPQNNLWRAIAWRTGSTVKADRSDAFVVCDGDTPKVYAPLTEMKGAFFPHRVFAGVAIYDGKTGDLTIENDYKGDLPVYPQSLATHQREAHKTSDGFWSYVFGRAGFEDTSKDSDDPNGDNRAEFGLATVDGKTSQHVTPLTSRGSSSSIIALGTVQSNTATKGDLNSYVIHQYADGKSRQANSAIAARITSEVLSGYKSQGLTVFEVVPNKNGDWVATIGKSQSILYRAVISEDGNVKLLDKDGNRVSGGDDSSTGDGSKDSSDLKLGKPIDQMSDQELRDAGTKILDELARRSESSKN